MKFKIVLLFAGCWLLVSSLTGCEGVRKKFTRPPKKTEEPKHIALPVQEYVEAYPKDITYNNHFIFWKYWHQELIDALGTTNRKKELECAEQLVSNLESMRSLLAEEKGKELDPYLKELSKTIGQIKQGNLSEPKIQYLKRDLEKQKRQIDREFSLNKVKECLKQ